MSFSGANPRLLAAMNAILADVLDGEYLRFAVVALDQLDLDAIATKKIELAVLQVSRESYSRAAYTLRSIADGYAKDIGFMLVALEAAPDIVEFALPIRILQNIKDEYVRATGILALISIALQFTPEEYVRTNVAERFGRDDLIRSLELIDHISDIELREQIRNLLTRALERVEAKGSSTVSHAPTFVTVKRPAPPDESHLRPVLRRENLVRVENGDVELFDGGLERVHLIAVNAELVLTPSALSRQVGPYLEAIEQIQHVIDEVRGAPLSSVVIANLSSGSALVDMFGAAESIKILREEIVPWRREHAKKLAEAEEKRLAAELKAKEAEIAESKARTDKERAEALRIAAEAKGAQIQNNRAAFELEREQINFALELLDKIKPNMAPDEKIAYLMRLRPPLDELARSPLVLLLDHEVDDTDEEISQ